MRPRWYEPLSSCIRPFSLAVTPAGSLLSQAMIGTGDAAQEVDFFLIEQVVDEQVAVLFVARQGIMGKRLHEDSSVGPGVFRRGSPNALNVNDLNSNRLLS